MDRDESNELGKKAVLYCQRVKLCDRATAWAWLRYCAGQVAERPLNVPHRIVYWLAWFGFVDPLGFDLDEFGRSMSRPTPGRRRKSKGKLGRQPEALRKWAVDQRNWRAGNP